MTIKDKTSVKQSQIVKLCKISLSKGKSAILTKTNNSNNASH